MKGFCNLASKEILHFKSVVKGTVTQTLSEPIVGKAAPVLVSMKFFTRRPDTDFTDNCSGEGRLARMLQFVRRLHPHIDNLVKFAFDALNGQSSSMMMIR
jgi:Holliday junction resolvase RusA-like endonuclease